MSWVEIKLPGIFSSLRTQTVPWSDTFSYAPWLQQHSISDFFGTPGTSLFERVSDVASVSTYSWPPFQFSQPIQPHKYWSFPNQVNHPNQPHNHVFGFDFNHHYDKSKTQFEFVSSTPRHWKVWMGVGLEAAASANLLLDHRLDPALHKEQKPKQIEIKRVEIVVLEVATSSTKSSSNTCSTIS